LVDHLAAATAQQGPKKIQPRRSASFALLAHSNQMQTKKRALCVQLVFLKAKTPRQCACRAFLAAFNLSKTKRFATTAKLENIQRTQARPSVNHASPDGQP
jgi:hypothetical protein